MSRENCLAVPLLAFVRQVTLLSETPPNMNMSSNVFVAATFSISGNVVLGNFSNTTSVATMLRIKFQLTSLRVEQRLYNGPVYKKKVQKKLKSTNK